MVDLILDQLEKAEQVQTGCCSGDKNKCSQQASWATIIEPPNRFGTGAPRLPRCHHASPILENLWSPKKVRWTSSSKWNTAADFHGMRVLIRFTWAPLFIGIVSITGHFAPQYQRKGWLQQVTQSSQMLSLQWYSHRHLAFKLASNAWHGTASLAFHIWEIDNHVTGIFWRHEGQRTCFPFASWVSCTSGLSY